jgi:DNA polymerase-1
MTADAGTPGPPDSGREPLAILDGHFLIFRAYHALPELRAPDGVAVHAVLGFAQSLLKLRPRLPPLVLVAFDSDPVVSFRTRLFPAYKRHRGRPPADLEPQFALCIEATRVLGYAGAVAADYEADDVMATAVRRFGVGGRPIELLTQDKDLVQLVSPAVTWIGFDGKLRLDPAAVGERFGVRPEQIPDYLALVGDSVDGIPGVPGVGTKTARALLARFKDVEDMLTHLRDLPAAVARALGADPARVRLSRRLAELRDDVALDLELRDLRPRGVQLEEARRFFGGLGLHRFVERLEREATGR